MPATWDITIDQGSSWLRTLTFDQPLTGLSARGQIRRAHSAADVLASFTASVVDENTLALSLSAATTATLPLTTSTRWVYDIELHNGDDSYVERIVEGSVTVTPEVTR